MKLYPLGSKVSYPLNQSWKMCSQGFSRARSRVSAQSFCFIVELSLVQQQASPSPSVHCVGPHGPEPCGQMQGSVPHVTGEPGAQEDQEHQEGGLPLFRSLNTKSPCACSAHAYMPILGNALFLGMSDRQAPSHITQTLLGMRPLSSPFPQQYAGIRPGEC